jgi:hypothetical protein
MAPVAQKAQKRTKEQARLRKFYAGEETRVNEKSWSIHVDNESIKDILLEVLPGITKFIEYVTQELTQPKIDSW